MVWILIISTAAPHFYDEFTCILFEHKTKCLSNAFRSCKFAALSPAIYMYDVCINSIFFIFNILKN